MKTPEEMAEEYGNQDKVACAAINRDAEDLVKDAFLAGYQAAQQWISVKERLPEDNQTCLYTIYIPKKNERKLDYGEWQAEEEVFYGEYLDYRDLNLTVTYWMPLPEPPKEEK